MKRSLVLAAVALCASPALASAGSHGESSAILAMLVVILVASKFAGAVAHWFGQPAVLGELLAGVLLGNAVFMDAAWLAAIPRSPVIQTLAQLGVIILLFEVGLESTVRDMLKVGWPSLLVACIGVAVPFGLGAAASVWLLPGQAWY